MKWNLQTFDRVIETRHPIAHIRDGELIIERRKKVGEDWQTEKQMVDTLVAADVFQLQHGYEYYSEVDGKRRRTTKLAPFCQPMPEQPQRDAKAVYVLPIYAASIGGRADLVADDRVSSEGLARLFAEFDGQPEIAAGCVPLIGIADAEDTEFGLRPVFVVSEYVDRPQRWGAKLNG